MFLHVLWSSSHSYATIAHSVLNVLTLWYWVINTFIAKGILSWFIGEGLVLHVLAQVSIVQLSCHMYMTVSNHITNC